MAMKIETICRYPVKGLSAQTLSEIGLVSGEGLPGDRRFAIARGAARPGVAAGAADGAWQPKSAFHQLMNDEKLAQLRVHFDPAAKRMTLERHGRQVAAGDPTDPQGRLLLTQFFSAFLGTSAPRLIESRGQAFTDLPDPLISLINLASVRDLGRVVGHPPDPRRFRANLYLSGAEPWAESGWIGRSLRIGNAVLRIASAIERCAATNVDPDSAERDLNLPLALQRGFGHCQMGLYLEVLEAGSLRSGDAVTLL